MPLKKTCSLKAFKSNFKKEMKKRSKSQALAISYKTLKDVCGVSSKKRMTPKEIVKGRKK